MNRRLRWIVGFLVGLLLLGASLPGQTLATQVALAVSNLTTGVTSFTRLRIVSGDYINWGTTSDAAGFGIRDNAGTLQFKASTAGTWLNFAASATLPTAASYWTRVAETDLTNETALSTLATALLLNTTATGAPVAYTGTTCTNQFVRSLSAVGAATCATVAFATDTSGTLTVDRGGTGLTVGTSGGILAFTATGTIASSAALTANRIVIGGGAGVAPTILGSLGTTTTILHGNAAGAPTFSAASLTADVTGILPGANGGTGNGFLTIAGPASARTWTGPDVSTTLLTTNAVITTAQGGTGLASYTTGDVLYASGATTLAALADAATGNALISGGVGVAPSYGKIGLTTHINGTLGATNGGTGLAAYTTGDLIYASSGTTLAVRNAVALGQTLISQGAATAPIWSTALRVSTINLTAALTFSGATPTISSGFGTTPSVTAGTAAAFRVNVGTGGTATQGIIALPTATTGWNCAVTDLTAVDANQADRHTVQIQSSATTATVENQTISTGAALAWSASDVLAVSCVAY